VRREAELLVSGSVHVNVSGDVDGDGYNTLLQGEPAERASISAVHGYGCLPPISGSLNESLAMHVCAW
jgi:hypothetical protein